MRKKYLKLRLKFERYKRVRLNKRLREARVASRHPYAVPLLTIPILLLFIGIFLLVLNQVQDSHKITPFVVIISHDHVVQTVPSIEPTVGALLKKLNITLNQGDVVEPSLQSRINEDKFRINIYRALPVVIEEGSQKIYTFSAATTPRAVAQQAGINLYPEDLVTSKPTNNFISNQAIGQVVTIKQSVPINLILYGTPIVTRTHSSTVAEMLAEKNIVLQKGDTVMPGLTTPITPNMEVFILHAGTDVVTATQTISAPVQSIDDPSLSVGSSAIRQQGSDGELLITYEVNEKTGVKTQLQSAQIEAPVPEIIAIGTAPVTSSLSTWLYDLRQCESGGNYQDDTGNGYYGAYQFSLGTWERLGLSGLPNDAPPAVQDSAIVKNTNLSSGGIASQNPGCYEKTGISAFPPSQ